MKKDREIVHEDDGATNRRVSRRTSNATQERDIDSSSSSSDDGGNGDSRQGGGTGEGTRGNGSASGGYVSQIDPGMSWAQGDENYYATQDRYMDIDQGYGNNKSIWKY